MACATYEKPWTKNDGSTSMKRGFWFPVYPIHTQTAIHFHEYFIQHYTMFTNVALYNGSLCSLTSFGNT